MTGTTVLAKIKISFLLSEFCTRDRRKGNCIVHADSTYQKKKVQGGSLIREFFLPKIT